MVRAYQGLKAHKSAAGICTEALKHVGKDKALEAEARSLRGVALFALPRKRMTSDRSRPKRTSAPCSR